VRADRCVDDEMTKAPPTDDVADLAANALNIAITSEYSA
jgi:hypothetical protein